MTPFEFASAGRIVFGRGSLQQLPALLAPLGRKLLVVTGSRSERAAPLLDLLNAQGFEHSVFSVSGEPTTSAIRSGVDAARKAKCEVVIGFGGGSVIDAGKAIAALLTNPGDPFDYLEVVGRGNPLKAPSAPYIAIPTTSGTGAEVTKNAVLASEEHKVKVSLRSNWMLPTLALVDSALTHSVPPDVTAATGLDALTQVLEPYVSNKANPLTDALCREGMRRGARSLLRCFENGNDADAREDMSITSLFGGLALANAKLGAVHGFAGPVGGMFPAPHGAVCARLLPLVMEANLKALRQREPESPVLRRYTEVAELLTGRPRASAEDGVAFVRDLASALGIPAFASYGMKAADVPTVVEKARVASSMKGNPIELTREELSGVLERAI